jgi:hypothetical protein
MRVALKTHHGHFVQHSQNNIYRYYKKILNLNIFFSFSRYIEEVSVARTDWVEKAAQNGTSDPEGDFNAPDDGLGRQLDLDLDHNGHGLGHESMAMPALQYRVSGPDLVFFTPWIS